MQKLLTSWGLLVLLFAMAIAIVFYPETDSKPDTESEASPSSETVAVRNETWRLQESSDDMSRVVRIQELAYILTDTDSDAESGAARILADGLQKMYSVEVTITDSPPEQEQPCFIFGRKAALTSGMVTEQELEQVKYDGYVIKCDPPFVVIAGYAPQGTIYATHRFLRKVGLKTYPWRDGPGSAVEVIEPLEDGLLGAFTEYEKPFFDYRALLGWLDRGRWGATLNGSGGLGDFRDVQDHEFFKGKGWLGGDHSAPYLVPMALYHDEHPEYYALRGEKRLPKTIKNCRVTLCLSNPDVHRIAAERAIDWIARQNDRRFFYISDGDADQCWCPACEAVDPFPRQSADRYLKWVNSVAMEVGNKYPDIVVLTLAYGSSVKPPLNTKPHSNVVVMYCPWFWNSRGTSATTWANPFNITAMREFQEWNTQFPGQIGIYDYPDTWAFGMAERIKFLAKENVRVYYSCGGAGDLLQWLGSQLLWNPFLSVADLTDEFMTAYYGPAAQAMNSLATLKQQQVKRRMYHTRNVFADPEYVAGEETLLSRAEAAAAGAEPDVARRILTDVYDQTWDILQRTHPVKGAENLRRAPDVFERDVRRFVALAKQISGMLGDPKQHAARNFNSSFTNRIASISSDADPAAGARTGDSDNVFDHAIASVTDYADRLGNKPVAEITDRKDTVTINPGTEQEWRKWRFDSSQPNLIERGTVVGMNLPDGPRQGLKFNAPLTALPEIKRNKLLMNAGRFFIERKFDTPWNIAGRRFLNFHIIVSGADVPATLYINGLHSDVNLHAGEQIVRVDLMLYPEQRFNFKNWDGDVNFLGIELWPQNNFYPFDETSDVEITLLSVSADNNRRPSPETLPYHKKTVWMSKTEPTIPRGIAIPKEHWDALMQRELYRHVGLDYGSRWISERFRTWTEHRVLTPVYNILVGHEASSADIQAAERVREHVKLLFGVSLPVNRIPKERIEATGNSFILGKSAVLATGSIKQESLKAAGGKGFVIDASAGRIAIAGGEINGTFNGVTRYLKEYGLLFNGANLLRNLNYPVSMLHELYVVDFPYFDDFPLTLNDGGRTKASRDDEIECRKLADVVKTLARSGKRVLPKEIRQRASDSALSSYVINRLLWDPFADTTSLINEFYGKF